MRGSATFRTGLLAVLAFALFVTFGTGCTGGERVIDYDGFVLTEEPSDAPRVFPYGFVYPGAQPIMSGVYTRSPYASTREGALVYESNDPIQQIQSFYLTKLEAEGWQIIQTQEHDQEKFILAENLSRRLFTVILRQKATAAAAPESGTDAVSAAPVRIP